MQHEYDKYLKAVLALYEEMGWSPRPPCSEDEIEDLRLRARKMFDTDIPDQYAQFLRITNGLLASDHIYIWK